MGGPRRSWLATLIGRQRPVPHPGCPGTRERRRQPPSQDGRPETARRVKTPKAWRDKASGVLPEKNDALGGLRTGEMRRGGVGARGTGSFEGWAGLPRRAGKAPGLPAQGAFRLPGTPRLEHHQAVVRGLEFADHPQPDCGGDSINRRLGHGEALAHGPTGRGRASPSAALPLSLPFFRVPEVSHASVTSPGNEVTADGPQCRSKVAGEHGLGVAGNPLVFESTTVKSKHLQRRVGQHNQVRASIH